MGRWADLDSDSARLPHGMIRIGYDADTQVYTYRDRGGRIYEGAPGARYGVLRPRGNGDHPYPTARDYLNAHPEIYGNDEEKGDGDDDDDNNDISTLVEKIVGPAKSLAHKISKSARSSRIVVPPSPSDAEADVTDRQSSAGPSSPLTLPSRPRSQSLAALLPFSSLTRSPTRRLTLQEGATQDDAAEEERQPLSEKRRSQSHDNTDQKPSREKRSSRSNSSTSNKPTGEKRHSPSIDSTDREPSDEKRCSRSNNSTSNKPLGGKRHSPSNDSTNKTLSGEKRCSRSINNTSHTPSGEKRRSRSHKSTSTRASDVKRRSPPNDSPYHKPSGEKQRSRSNNGTNPKPARAPRRAQTMRDYIEHGRDDDRDRPRIWTENGDETPSKVKRTGTR